MIILPLCDHVDIPGIGPLYDLESQRTVMQFVREVAGERYGADCKMYIDGIEIEGDTMYVSVSVQETPIATDVDIRVELKVSEWS